MGRAGAPLAGRQAAVGVGDDERRSVGGGDGRPHDLGVVADIAERLAHARQAHGELARTGRVEALGRPRPRPTVRATRRGRGSPTGSDAMGGEASRKEPILGAWPTPCVSPQGSPSCARGAGSTRTSCSRSSGEPPILPERDLYQGLVHVAVATYQDSRGNEVGRTRQLEKALRRLAPYAPAYAGVDDRGAARVVPRLAGRGSLRAAADRAFSEL